jgi:3-oxoacyl-[acyl-carrier-protein] synthase III
LKAILPRKSTKTLVLASEHNTAYSDDMDDNQPSLGDGAGAVFISSNRVSEEDIEFLI